MRVYRYLDTASLLIFFSATSGSFSSNVMRFLLLLVGIREPEFVDLDGIITRDQVSRRLWPAQPVCMGHWGTWSRFRLLSY